MKAGGAFLMLSITVLLASGCAHELVYRPAALGAADAPAVRYAVPPESPRGDVYVTSFGFTDLGVSPGQTAPFLHARLAVSNAGPGGWAIDGRQQQLLVPGQPPIPPSFLNTDAGEGPFYAIPPGTARLFDFFFAVPPPLDQAQNLPSFAFSWRVLAGAEPIAQRTPFQRFEGDVGGAYETYPPYLFVGLGFGVGWWYGPVFVGYHRPPAIRGYYYPPRGARASGSWRGSPGQSAWRGAPPGRAASGGGWRGGGHGGGGHR
jgi:hypothetical protein